MAEKNFSSVDNLLTTLKAMTGGPSSLIVAIDARGGAGKSSLARSITAAIRGAAHIEFDWFHLPRSQATPEQRFDHQRLRTEVLIPYAEGIRSFQLRRYNWGYLAGVEDGFHTEPVTLSSVTTLVIEGCETLHPELSPHYDVRIWLDTSAEESKLRGVQRDIEEYKLNPEKVNACWNEWVAREAQSSQLEERRCQADWIIS